MLNLLDSHDTHRFFKEVEKDREKMKAALCLLYLFPGVPCIFYGTEILTEGGYDPDCRRCMDWNKIGAQGEFKDVYKLLQNLSNLRKKYEISESVVEITAKEDALVIEHNLKNDVLRLYINVTGKEQVVDEITIKSNSYAIWVNGGVMNYE